MKILTEPIGSIPRPKYLVDALDAFDEIGETELSKLFNEAVKDTIKRFEETVSPVITDGEQTKPSFATGIDKRSVYRRSVLLLPYQKNLVSFPARI
jgi:5-methyltetrahydropteroyltriglutamate--homocysteine methyltransferase